MKYALLTTQYWPDSEMVEERYIVDDAKYLFFESKKLSEAMVWDTFDEAADYILDNEMDYVRVVPIKDKDYFIAKLAGK